MAYLYKRGQDQKPKMSAALTRTPGERIMNTEMIEGTNLPTPNPVTPFEQVLPYDKVFNQGMISQLAESQLRPEWDRNRYQGMRELDRSLAGTGAWRLGTGQAARTSLRDAYDRNFAEQKMDYTSTVNDYLTDWYERNYQQYYTNPGRFQAPALPTWDDYSRQVGEPTMSGGYTYQSPYKTSSTGSLYFSSLYK